MSYDIKTNLCKLSLAIALNFCFMNLVNAQEVVNLGTNAPAESESDISIELGGIPDEIALFENGSDDLFPDSGMITPAASNTPPAPATGPNGVPVINSLNAPKPAMPAAIPAPGSGPSLPPQNVPKPQPAAPTLGGVGSASGGVGGGLPKVSANPLFPPKSGIATTILDEVDDEVFAQMSDIEKQTALLTLELRREKIKNEIEAIKTQREKAIEEQKNIASERDLKRLEMEKEQERMIIEEQLKLRKMEFAFEKLRQENLLKEYKEQMLNEEQKWIKTNMEIYAQVAKAKEERDNWTGKYRDRLSQLADLSNVTLSQVQGFVDMQKREISDLQTQISILKARLEAQQRTNPFGEGAAAQGGAQGTPGQSQAMAPSKPTIKLGDLYVIMEITGKGDDLLAKVMNREGQKFLAKVGTKLKSGDVVDEITTTYIRTDNDGDKDYLYFSAGGVLEEEPENKATKRALAAMAATEKRDGAAQEVNPRGLITSSGVPGVTRDMMLR